MALVQLSLYGIDPERDAAVDRALAQVERNADEAWLSHALNAVWYAASAYPAITTDEVWRRISWTPREPRAMGAVMRRAVREGWIRPTKEYQPSQRVGCNHRPVLVWASRIYREAA